MANHPAPTENILQNMQQTMGDMLSTLATIQTTLGSIDRRLTSIESELRILHGNNRTLVLYLRTQRGNQDRKRHNAAALLVDIHSTLLPLFDLVSGEAIPGFPRTLASLYELDAFTLRRILTSLDMPVESSDLLELREAVRMASF